MVTCLLCLQAGLARGNSEGWGESEGHPKHLEEAEGRRDRAGSPHPDLLTCPARPCSGITSAGGRRQPRCPPPPPPAGRAWPATSPGPRVPRGPEAGAASCGHFDS